MCYVVCVVHNKIESLVDVTARQNEGFGHLMPKVSLECIIRDGLHVLVIMLQYHVVESVLFCKDKSKAHSPQYTSEC